ncbi:sugar ABC transporter ATP-binding protein [Streptomyces sp. SKN60]|uniref:sugar ABC transporter ATP-binding protein n=1 Tax=Streptomyces sp. SKN60 TaxID=2855506 RepID=UPI0022474FF4|nr:sugar ABC transporter ATP-binding protein [Streptomyces sp. SKN60]MCX2185760.1 sugar ABC transporter ATP-binding protein [Streptomyces sp. SKN60]
MSKSFGTTRALDEVSFEIGTGTVHALVGGNGSGKSTLVKILAGVHHADAGELNVGGRVQDLAGHTPVRAHDLGLRFVHQQPSTFLDLSVAENLALGRGFEHGASRRIKWNELRHRARHVLERFAIDASPDDEVRTLGPATRTMVAIARALQDQEATAQGLLILDEPTATLTRREVDILLAALRRYAAAGQAILFITHRLDEVERIADSATVLRDGRVAGTLDRDGIRHDRLVAMITGRWPTHTALQAATPGTAGQLLLEARGVRGSVVRDVDMALRSGEILGLAGLLGSGRSTLLRLLFGETRMEAGTVFLAGEPLRLRSPCDGIRAGIAYLSEDRLSDGAFPTLSVRENISIGDLRRYRRLLRINRGKERREVLDLVARYRILTASPEERFAVMSGGNQQKTILARWMHMTPKVLLLDEPTQGVDVSSRQEIYDMIRHSAARGAGVVVASSDFGELVTLCDRALVLKHGRVVRSFDKTGFTETDLNEALFLRTGYQ